jgi:hypothetical protein
MPNIKIYTTSEASTKHYLASSGQVYTTFSEAMFLQSEGKTVAGPKQFMIKTTELDEFVELVTTARDAWKKAKEVEIQTNV